MSRQTFYAGVGGGAWCQVGDDAPERIAVSDRTRLRGARVGMHHPVDPRPHP